MACLTIRRNLFEFGLLPLYPLLPRLDGPAALQPVQRRLLANSVPCTGAREHRRMVGVSAVAESLGLSEAQAQIVMNALAAVSPPEDRSSDEGSASEGDSAGADAREADMHWLLLFLFLQMYSRPHVQARLLSRFGV